MLKVTLLLPLLTVFGYVFGGNLNLPNVFVPYGVPRIHTVTVTETISVLVTDTHLIEQITTSDVTITHMDTVTSTVFHYSTNFDYVPEPSTFVTSIVRVSSTPVVIVTDVALDNRDRTVTTISTEFLTVTDNVQLVYTVTHIALDYQIRNVPKTTVQVLFQENFSTVTNLVTDFVTSTTMAYS